MSHRGPADNADLDKLQHESFNYFLKEVNPANGLVLDKTAANWPASIAATGLALAGYPVAVERGFSGAPSRSSTNSDHAAVLLDEPTGTGTRRHRSPRLLLSFSRLPDRAARMAMRAVDDRQRHFVGWRPDCRRLFRC